VQQAVDALFDLDERAVVGQVAHPPGNPTCSGGYFSATWVHGFDLGLLHAERDLLLVLVDVEHDHLDRRPTLISSDGWLIRRVQLISEMCTRPSTPGSSLTNAP
jgi:hypothetical protein